MPGRLGAQLPKLLHWELVGFFWGEEIESSEEGSFREYALAFFIIAYTIILIYPKPPKVRILRPLFWGLPYGFGGTRSDGSGAFRPGIASDTVGI